MVDANEELVSDTSEKLRGVEWSTDYADQLEDPHIEAVVPPPSSSPGPTRGLTGRGSARLRSETRDGETFYKEAD